MVPSPMRCLLCNAEMTLISAVKDESLMASGFERHTYMCSACGDTERRFVFNKIDKQDDHDQQHTNATLAPEPNDVSPSNPDESAGTQDFLRRVLSKIRIQS